LENPVELFEWHNMPVPAQKIFPGKNAYGKAELLDGKEIVKIMMDPALPEGS
jgi:hypothetical protein